MLVTSCRDNICRIWVQTLIPEDGLVDLQQIEAIANQNLRIQTQRHRRKMMQRLKHMKYVYEVLFCFSFLLSYYLKMFAFPKWFFGPILKKIM